MFEWYVVRCGSKNGHKMACVEKRLGSLLKILYLF